MIKLVAFDLDGTIIDKTGLIYENNFKAINDLNKKNIEVSDIFYAFYKNKNIFIIKNDDLL